jgi:hypothetical protein
MADAANASGAVKSNLNQALATIKSNEELFKALGISTGTTGDEARVAATQDVAAGLRASGRARIARAGTPGSKEAEDLLAGKLSAAAAAAEIAKTGAQGRLDAILGLGDLSGPSRALANAKFLGRYGYSMSPEQSADLERGNIASQQGIIDRFTRFGRSRADRAVRRSELAGGQKDLSDAAGMDNTVVELLRQIAAGIAGRAPMPQNEVAGSSSVKLYEFIMNQPALMAAIERANAAQAALIKNLQTRP